MSKTIASIATASGNGSISIIRVSGDDAVKIADSVFVHSGQIGSGVLLNASSHTIHYGWIGDDFSNLIDEVIVLLMRAPRSYTAEDVVEIHCHGGGLSAKRILELLISRGVNLAEPGEFTKRAFLNGRIDLTQAESVMEIISAGSDLALKTATDHLRGDIKDIISSMREVILGDMAYLEAALDDPEHIELDNYTDTLLSHLQPIEDEIRELIRKAENGRLVSEGIRTAIVGRPNVGKSSFLNCILREDRAIVTDIPGTTRDTLEEDVRIGGILLRLIDTAGIRDTSDTIEKIGVEKARETMKSADFIIHVIDAGVALNEEDISLMNFYKDYPHVVLLNKSDLDTVITREDILDDPERIVDFSAKTGEGLDTLEKLLEDLFLSEFYDKNNTEPLITGLRQKEALIETELSFEKIHETIDAGMPEDLLTVDLLAAYTSLGKVTGETVEDDLADKIFSEFCMGK